MYRLQFIVSWGISPLKSGKTKYINLVENMPKKKFRGDVSKENKKHAKGGLTQNQKKL